MTKILFKLHLTISLAKHLFRFIKPDKKSIYFLNTSQNQVFEMQLLFWAL
jgi:hypothetical protein